MANLLLKNVYKTYSGNVSVVTDFNLKIQDQEFIVLVGPSGCGKSTTLRMIAGLEEITSGEIYIGGKLMNDVSPKDRDIAMVFQNYALYPHMTVYENMAFGLKINKLAKDQIYKKVSEVAKILDIIQLLDRKPKELSGGQRQRVALGRAMVRESKVFLMDEPLSNLDAKLRTQMRSEIAKLHQKLKTTFVYVTHDQTEAMTMGTRIVVMKDGIIQQVNTPKNIYDYPENMFVAGFIGSPQINFIETVVIEKDRKIVLPMEDGTILNLSDKQQETLRNKNYLNKNIVLGIRPEHFHYVSVDELSSNCNVIKAEVEVTELTGAELYLHVKIASHSAIARVDANIDIKNFDTVTLQFHFDKMHLFDKETQKIINEG